MRSFKALKNIAVYGKYVKMDEVIQMEDEKAKAFLEKNLVEEVKDEKKQDKKPSDKEQDKKSDNSKNQKI